MTVELIMEDDRWGGLGLQDLADRACNTALAHLALDPEACEIALLACDDARIAALNADFRGKARPTNVLSWPAQDLSPQEPGAAPRPPREFAASVWFALSVGHTGRAEARWLLPKICEAGGITRDSIGAIRVREGETYIQIAVADAPRFGEAMEIEPGLRMVRLKGEPSLDRKPEHRAAPKTPKTKQGRHPKARDAAIVNPATGDQSVRSPARPAPATAPEAKSPAKPHGKPRWSTAQKVAKARKGKAEPKHDGKSAGGKGDARPSSKTRGKHATHRSSNGGSAPPRRPKGKG